MRGDHQVDEYASPPGQNKIDPNFTTIAPWLAGSIYIRRPTHRSSARMPFVQTFRRAHSDLPPLVHGQDPAEALVPMLSELASFYNTHVQPLPATSRHLVCDLSNNVFSLQHLECIASRLQQPHNSVSICALDLSFNRIYSPTWEAFVPLVKKLSMYVQHMDFIGNYLPDLLESDHSLKSLNDGVSLSVTFNSRAGDPWVDSWTEKSRQFKEAAYNFSQIRW